MNFEELYENKNKEMKEKYAEVIKHLAEKDGVDLGVAFDELKAIAYANLENQEILYKAEIDYDLIELIRDYAELRFYSHKCANK